MSRPEAGVRAIRNGRNKVNMISLSFYVVAYYAGSGHAAPARPALVTNRQMKASLSIHPENVP
jgi:hypothetical protein